MDSEPGDVDTSEQVVLISLNNVNTLSSVKAQMEFVYSDERFTGPEVTSAIPPYCKLKLIYVGKWRHALHTCTHKVLYGRH